MEALRAHAMQTKYGGEVGLDYSTPVRRCVLSSTWAFLLPDIPRGLQIAKPDGLCKNLKP